MVSSMAIDFEDPTTWDQDLSETEALSLGIFALNTLAAPDGSSDAQMTALDFFSDGALEALARLRERLSGSGGPAPDATPLAS